MRIPLFTFIAASTLSTLAASASMIGEREFKCPLGGEVFKSTVAMSGTSWGQRFDLKKLGPIYQPWPTPVCPTNGFVMYKESFTEEELANLKSFIASDNYQQLRAQHSTHYLAAKMEERLGITGWPVVWLYLQATWETETSGMQNQTAYLEALQTVLEEYSQGLVTNTDEWLTGKLLLANTQRRLKNFEAAIETAQEVQAAYADDNRKHIKDMLNRFIMIAETGDARPRGIDEESDRYLDAGEQY